MPNGSDATFGYKDIYELWKAVSLLGGGPFAFSQAFGTLTVELPDSLPSTYTNTMAIELKQ